jgi:uncharacterized protein
MPRQFGIFAKFWQPGQVKTRLAAQIGDVAAAGFHRTCLETLLARFRHVADRRVLGFAPADRQREFAALAGSGWMTEPQSEGDLGHRMAAYFASAFAAGASSVVLIGADSPNLSQAVVTEAFERLVAIDAVLGPSDDGGYYLIGMSRPLPSAFNHIDWSTPLARSQTIEQIEAAGGRYELLDPWYDVDTIEDLRRLRAELETNLSDDFAKLRQWLRELGCESR